jgi:hypothetical protein
VKNWLRHPIYSKSSSIVKTRKRRSCSVPGQYYTSLRRVFFSETLPLFNSGRHYLRQIRMSDLAALAERGCIESWEGVSKEL